jgi:hypothetical protein
MSLAGEFGNQWLMLLLLFGSAAGLVSPGGVCTACDAGQLYTVRDGCVVVAASSWMLTRSRVCSCDLIHR